MPKFPDRESREIGNYLPVCTSQSFTKMAVGFDSCQDNLCKAAEFPLKDLMIIMLKSPKLLSACSEKTYIFQNFENNFILKH